ncbi:hypothetical protein JCM10908_005648 [Rhodotorula pacifica]|uniref:uncharacterized protein n=1 Tax=Rhodotorula pacifica TaxID=1495444 RepID=UPI00317BCF32
MPAGRFIDLTSLLTLAALAAVGPAGYGRFSCSVKNGDGTISGDQSLCANSKLVPPGSGSGGTGFQGDEPNPANPTCKQDPNNGFYYCGIAGAACLTNTNCDNGVCTGFKCSGSYGDTCNGQDSECLGFLYCTDLTGNPIPSDTCGGLGAFCQDPDTSIPGATNAVQESVFNQYCASQYCSFNQGVCSEHVTTVGGDCSSDPEFACSQTAQGQPLFCQSGTNTCQLVNPSARARVRRSKREVCPNSFTACPIDNRAGFECIDIQSNLEQCGACATQGGVDCTSILGVEAVGCVAGRCEIWSCAEGYTYDSDSTGCRAVVVPELVEVIDDPAAEEAVESTPVQVEETSSS